MSYLIALCAILTLVVVRLRHGRHHVKEGMQSFADEVSATTEQEWREVSVSFLVPAWNAHEDIVPFIESFNGLTVPRKQLVLCAGGGDTLQRASKFAGEAVLVLEQRPGMGKQAALRESYPHCVGDYIFLTDVDCRLSDHIVGSLLDCVLKNGVEAVTGPICPLAEQRGSPFVMAQWAVERYLALRTPEYVNGIRGNNAVVSRRAIDATGAFRQETFSGTDYTLAQELLREGYQIRYQPGAEMPSSFPGSLRVYTRKQARWVRNVLVLGLRYGDSQGVRATAITLLLPFGYAVLLATGIWIPGLWVVLVALLINSLLNRLAYGMYSGIRVSTTAAVRHILGDLGAACTVWYQLLTGKFTW